MNIRLGVCLTGPAGSGKTTVIKVTEKLSSKIRRRYLDIQAEIKKKKEEMERKKDYNEDQEPNEEAEKKEKEENSIHQEFLKKL